MVVRIQCTRRLTFCAGHRVLHHEGKCAAMHGHNYVVYITAEAPRLDALGRVVDFSVLKEKVGSWIETHWDHTFLVYHEDKAVLSALQSVPSPKPPFICPFNPTAEEMANYLLTEVCPQVLEGYDICITGIALYETENCSATATRMNTHG